jgi:hypothetical protein
MRSRARPARLTVVRPRPKEATFLLTLFAGVAMVVAILLLFLVL